MRTLNYYVPFFVNIMVESELKVLEREALWHSVVEVQYGVVRGLDGDEFGGLMGLECVIHKKGVAEVFLSH